MTRSERKAGRVTIGIPTYNRSQFVIRAVRSALAQTYVDLEIVVSDNCSSDDTVRRIEELVDPRLVLLRQPQNMGVFANLNTCLARATGEFFLLLSDDDLLQPSAIERLSAAFRAPPGNLAASTIGLSWCPCHILNAEGQYMWTTAGGPATESTVSLVLGQLNGIRGARFCSIMIRTDDAIAVGGYDQKRYGPLCDMGNWTRAALKYANVVCIDEPLASYTMHQASHTSQSSIHEWLHFAGNLNDDLVELLAAREDAPYQRELKAAGVNHISNALATILLQMARKPGQLSCVFREMFHWRKFLLTQFVAKRIMRDGWKLVHLRRSTGKRYL